MRVTTAALVSCFATVLVACAGSSSVGDRSLNMRKRVLGELVSQRDWPAAFDAARELHAEHPDDAEVLTARGIIYREQRLYREAEDDLKAAVAEAPRLSAAHAALGVLWDIQSRFDEALAEHRRAVELEENNPEYLNNLGFSLLAHDKTQEAIEVLRKAVSLDPTSARVRNNLGFAYGKAGDFREAARQFSLGGTAAQAKNNLGFAYEAQGNLAQAYELYAEAARLDPTLERARANLTHVAERLNRPLPDDRRPPGSPRDQGDPP
jgi:Flp pilus assembly protein TadD